MVALLLPLQVHAQSVWTSLSHTDGIALEGYKPNFDQPFEENLDATFQSSVWFLSGRYTVHPSVRLGAEIGVSHYGIDENVAGFADDETAFGNMLLMGEWFTPVDNLIASVGVRLPTASNNNGIITGWYALDVDRINAFNPEVWTIQTEADYNLLLTDKVNLHLQGGPALMIDTFFDETTTDLLLRYGAQGWYSAPRFMAGAGFISRSFLTTESVDAGWDPTDLAVGASLIGKFRRYQPGINIQVPVTETYREVVDWIVGVSVKIPLNIPPPQN